MPRSSVSFDASLRRALPARPRVWDFEDARDADGAVDSRDQEDAERVDHAGREQRAVQVAAAFDDRALPSSLPSSSKSGLAFIASSAAPHDDAEGCAAIRRAG